jgi:peptidoglycan hydrolase-like protein with peptidoglycan-binding domain
MMTPRAKPILASAAIALSLAACQGMGGSGTGEAQQTSSTPYSGESQAAMDSREQAAGQQSRSQSAASAKQAQAVSPGLLRNVQRTLSERGYNAGPADGIYGGSTQQALRNFQRDQKLNSSGQLDSQTLAALGVVREGTRAATGLSENQGQAAGPRLSSEQIRDLQRELASRGYDTGAVDGQWGRSTQQALSQFQQDRNLPASGRPDQRTLAALGIEGAGIQTGEMPAESTRSPQPGGTQEGEMPRQEGLEPEGGVRQREETGQLPETPAPGAEQPSERSGTSEGIGPAPFSEDAVPQVTPSPEPPGETR